MSYISVVILVFIFFYLGYYGIKQSKTLLSDFLLETKEKVNDKKDTTFTTISLSEEEKELNNLKVKLDYFLRVEKMYLNPNLTLDMLSKKIEVTGRILSHYINKNTNFYTLINTYRLEDVKEKLVSKEYSKYSFLGIANECGFKSKTSFYRVFKEVTGISPSEYRKNQK